MSTGIAGWPIFQGVLLGAQKPIVLNEPALAWNRGNDHGTDSDGVGRMRCASSIRFRGWEQTPGTATVLGSSITVLGSEVSVKKSALTIHGRSQVGNGKLAVRSRWRRLGS